MKITKKIWNKLYKNIKNSNKMKKRLHLNMLFKKEMKRKYKRRGIFKKGSLLLIGVYSPWSIPVKFNLRTPWAN